MEIIRRKLGTRHRGQVLVMFALMSVVLVGMVGVAIDVGHLLSQRRSAQNAADAAAMAAARVILLDPAVSNATVRSEALDYVEENGFEVSEATVTRPYMGDNRKVLVTVTREVPPFFIGVVYNGDWNVTSSAVVNIGNLPGNYALVALDEDEGIYLNGDTGIIITDNGGSAMSNGDIEANGGPFFSTGGTIDAYGTIEEKEDWVAPEGIHQGMPQIDDPLAGLTKPSKPASLQPAPDCNNDCIFTPGYYKDLGAITVKDTATFQAGFYYFENTTLEMQNTNSRIEGEGVMMFFGNGSSFKPKNGEVWLNKTTLSSHSKKISVWIDNCSMFDSQGNGDFFIGGIFYAPCSQAIMHGNPGAEAFKGQVIVGGFSVKGTSDFRISYQGYTETFKKQVFLIE